MKFTPIIQPCTVEGVLSHKSGYVVTYLGRDGSLEHKFFADKAAAEIFVARGGARSPVQEVEILVRQLREALDALDELACWEGPPIFRIDWTVTSMRARVALERIRGGDGRPPPKVSR